ncbi:ATP-binding cassette domain-containing protein [Acaricomes phytoseiuli]|uniref:ABC transporter ATP-binding protein n=1 Tax=Acaricomes phytoseiuli TaxID=291968 RepID=UPI0003735BB7|nr:ATP-binding cassette domain-containing protein [Acaricomes phytoseiuli]MCW1248904.1 ATP-binding cassette domain-containing protein [Acaricomes phytoseiuli]
MSGQPLSEPIRPARLHAEGWGWQHAGRERPAIQGLDLTIEPGERVLLLGASGSGKSTFLQAAAGLLSGELDAEEQGRLLVDGRPAAEQRGRSGLMHQDPEAQVVLSRIGDDVAFGPENLAVPRAEIWPRVRAALDAVGLRLPLEHPTAQLSGGQKQRLGLAGLLAMRPGLWLLDEPTANLDPAGVVDVRDAVARSLDASGATLVVVEHRAEVWLGLVHRVIVLGHETRGESAVLFDGAPEALRPGIEQRTTLLAGLREAGIWVPGERPVTQRRKASSAQRVDPRDVLMTAQNLSVSRERKPRKRRSAGLLQQAAASGIDLSIAPGNALTITGPNGAGKTALALTLGGLLPAQAGFIRAEPRLARGLEAEPTSWTGPQLIERLGSVFQEPEHQFIAATVAAELDFGPRLLGRGMDRVGQLIERLRLGPLLAAHPFTLSGGEKRRLSVATVLAASPQVLILDEPTFGQDAKTWAELADLLIELLDEGVAIVSVSHDEAFREAIGGAELALTARQVR